EQFGLEPAFLDVLSKAAVEKRPLVELRNIFVSEESASRQNQIKTLAPSNLHAKSLRESYGSLRAASASVRAHNIFLSDKQQSRLEELAKDAKVSDADNAQVRAMVVAAVNRATDDERALLAKILDAESVSS